MSPAETASPATPATPPVRFCVLTTQRSGSTWLMSALHDVPGIASGMELFLPHSPAKDPTWLIPEHPESFYDWRRRTGAFRPGAVARYLREVEARDPAARAVGFKLMINQAFRYYPEVLPLLRARGYRFVLLTRDFFELAVSRYVVQRTRTSHLGTSTPATRRAPPKLHVDPNWLIGDMRRRQWEFRAARIARRLLGGHWHTVDYRVLQTDPHTALGGVLRHLGLADAPLPTDSRMVKVLAAPYSEFIVNYTEVLGAVREAGFTPPAPDPDPIAKEAPS